MSGNVLKKEHTGGKTPVTWFKPYVYTAGRSYNELGRP